MLRLMPTLSVPVLRPLRPGDEESAVQWSRDAAFFRGRTLRTGSFEDLQRWRAEGTQYGVIGGDVTITQEGDLVTDGGLSGVPTGQTQATGEGETR